MFSNHNMLSINVFDLALQILFMFQKAFSNTYDDCSKIWLHFIIVVFCNGPAGTGKTFLAVCFAISALEHNLIDKIVLCRPAVEAGENLGFLPGDLKDKVDPYLAPLYDALNILYDEKKLFKLLFSINL